MRDKTTSAGVLESSAVDYFLLLKPRVMSLVVFTGFVGAVMAPTPLHPFLLGVVILCIAIGAGAAGGINMWYDRDIDALMPRTHTRPIPAGKVRPEDALGFGVCLAVSSVITLGLTANYFASALLSFTIAFYIFIYTMWVKRHSSQGVVIGGIAGACPPLIGWAAVTGSLSIEPFLLFLIIFLWQAPHFWALALCCVKDYEHAGLPLLPVIRGPQTTCRYIFVYILLLVGASLLPTAIGMTGLLYTISALALGGRLIYSAWRLWKTLNVKVAKQLFYDSIFYLFALFLALLIDHLWPC